MSTVPYTFANSVGNIPLAYLDANFSNVKAAANTAGTVTTAAQPNITSVGTLSSLTVTGNVTAANFTGNISGNISNAVYAESAGTAGTVTTATQPNITSVGTLTVLTASGNIRTTGGAFVGSAAGLTNIPGANVTGTVANATSAASATTATSATTAGTVTTAAQPNITSVGTLSSLTVTGNITSSTGIIIGNASGLTNLIGANVTGTVANATYATSAGSATTATAAGTVTTAAQPNITSVGTLSSLTVTGNINSTGNISFGASGNGIMYTDPSGFSVLGTTDATNGSYILGDAGNVLLGAHPTYGVLLTSGSSNVANSRAISWNSGNLDLDVFGVAPGNISNVASITASDKVITTPVPFANLTAVAGARAFINNGNLIASGNFGAQISGGGANIIPVWSDGTNWYIG